MHLDQRPSPRSQADRIADRNRRRVSIEASKINREPDYNTALFHGPSPSEVSRRDAIDSSSQNFGQRSHQRRPLSPTTSFLAQIPLGNGSESRRKSSDTRNNADSREHENHQPHHNKSNESNNMDVNQHLQSHSIPILKRSAASSTLYPEVEATSKRQRLDSPGAEPFKGSVRRAMRSETPNTPRVLGKPSNGYVPNEASNPQLKDTIEPTSLQSKTDSPPSEPHVIRPAKRITYADAATQSDSISIPSSRLTQLQEEEAVALHKHKAEMTRRSEAMALELEHERQMLELRHQFAIRPAYPVYEDESRLASSMDNVSRPISSGTADRNGRRKETPLDIVKTTNHPSLQYQDPIATSDHQSGEATRPSNLTQEALFKESKVPAKQCTDHGERPITKVVSETKTSYRASPIVSKDTDGQGDGPKRTPTRISESLFLTPAGSPETSDKALAGRQDDTGLPKKPSERETMTVGPWTTSKTNDRPTSPSSSSVRIKTSPSPRRIRQQKPPIEPRRSLAPVKHLTCFFWQRGGCNKRREDCSYAHYDTGIVATNPETMRKRQKDDSWRYRPYGDR
ncbi:MAG: hypothetical protein Q9183_004265 [Haloplaca sp. 2 TL-2023]